MRHHLTSAPLVLALLGSLPLRAAEIPSITSGTFRQEVRREFTTADGLPANGITSVAVLDAKTVFAGTTDGLARFVNGRWTPVKGTAGAAVQALAAGKDRVLLVLDGRLL